MKKIIIAVVVLLAGTVAAPGKDFSSEISQINSAGFPKIAVMLKVFNKAPEELKADNFTISEDGAGISTFALTIQKNKHYMVLVIDRSSSIEPAMNAVKLAAAGFVKSMVSDVSMAILSFGSDLDFNHPFAEDGQSLVAAIGKIRPWGGTALYDALYSACEELHNKAGRSDLKTVVCLTDGRDSTPNGQTPMSIHTPAEVNKLAGEKGIRLITVGLGADIDEAVLKGFASATGGWYLQTTTPEQLSQLYEALSQRMKLERYYQLAYTTPRPALDGTRRNIGISSMLKGFQEQGKGYYIAPVRTVSRPEPVSASKPIGDGKGGKMTVSSLFQDLRIDGPDAVFLTGPIIPPPASPVFGLNAASLLMLSPADCQVIIDQARVRVSEEHRQGYDLQQKYLDGYQKSLERLAKENDELAASSLKDFERPRFEYRKQYLQMRLEEVALYAQKAYENYLIKQTVSMDELDYYQQTRVGGNAEDENFFATSSASETAALQVVDAKFAKQIEQQHIRMDKHFTATLDSRGANIEQNSTVVTEEIDLPDVLGNTGDNQDENDGSNSIDVPEIPDLKILDR